MRLSLASAWVGKCRGDAHGRAGVGLGRLSPLAVLTNGRLTGVVLTLPICSA